jgi:hypothetical protein
MEGMKTQDDILGQDDIDALLAGEDLKEAPDVSEDVDEETLEQEAAGTGLLGQDDIDALLSQVGTAGEDEPDPLSSLRAPAKVSDEYIRSLTVQLYNRSLLLREPGVQVIWNALNTLPMNTGMNLNIQGMEYKTLGILHNNHLVVKK